MRKIFEKCRRFIIIAFAARSLLCFLGKSDFSLGMLSLICGNEILADIGNELFFWVCFLAVFEAIGEFIDSINSKSVSHTGDAFGMNGLWQSNEFFLLAIFSFVAGVAFIGGGAALAYYKMGNLVVGLMLAAGILSEIAAICFGFLHHKMVEQITAADRPANKGKQLENREDR